MVGRWLGHLDDASLDSLLTNPFVPDSRFRSLVTVAVGADCTGIVLSFNPRRPLPWSFPFPRRDGSTDERVRVLTRPVSSRYCELCVRFGTARVNAAIRDRVLALKAWRFREPDQRRDG